MKNLKKILVTTILALTVALLPTAAMAAETTPPQYSDTEVAYSGANTETKTAEATENAGEADTEKETAADTENAGKNTLTEAEKTVPEAPLTDVETTQKTEDKTTPETEDKTASEKEDLKSEAPPESQPENAFQSLYNLCISHLSEILSLLAFAGSLICAFLYKSGLIPMLQKGLSALGHTAEKIKESTTVAEDGRRADYDALKTRLTTLDDSLTALGERLADYTDRLEEKAKCEAREKRLTALISEEIELLYDIFMASALPEYEKARVGERVAKMKEVISTYEGE
jgi:hypothetical protein